MGIGWVSWSQPTRFPRWRRGGRAGKRPRARLRIGIPGWGCAPPNQPAPSVDRALQLAIRGIAELADDAIEAGTSTAVRDEQTTAALRAHPAAQSPPPAAANG